MVNGAAAALLVLASCYVVLFVVCKIRKRGKWTRAVLTGGGSSGHIYPVIAIGKALEPEVGEFLYLGTKRRVEEEVVPKEGLPLKFIPAAPYPGLSLKLPFFAAILGLGIIKSAFILFFFQPGFVIGSGGFVSAPVVFGAFILKKLFLLDSKIILHEPNAAPGKLNLAAGKIADRMMVTFSETLDFFKGNGVLVGYPLRSKIKRMGFDEAKKRLPFEIPKNATVVFAFGGSQGSRTINRAVVDSLKYLLPRKEKVFMILSTGLGQSGYKGKEDVEKRISSNYSKEEAEEIKGFFHYDSYFYNVSELLSVSSLAISRSGAGSLFELAEMGIPSILIPKFGLEGEHQVMNALALEKVKGSVVLYETPFEKEGRVLPGVDGGELAGRILSLVDEPEKLRTMSENCKRVIPSKETALLIRKVILAKGAPEPAGEASTTGFKPLKSLAKAISELNGMSPGEIGEYFSAAEKSYYEAKALNLLYLDDWRKKNMGVKLAGLLKIRGAREKLLEMAVSREKAPLWERIFGGDYKEVGFVRRNCFTALKNISFWDEKLKKVIMTGIEDPYYEVRAEALKLAKSNADKLINDRPLLSACQILLKDKEFEAAREAALLMGEIGSEEHLKMLLDLKDHFFWQVREAGIIAVRRMVEKGAAFDKKELLDSISAFILTSTDFRPTFDIKENYRKLIKLVERE